MFGYVAYLLLIFLPRVPTSADECPAEKLRQSSARIVNQINRVIVNALSADVEHLREVEVDVEPRHEAFWFVGGISPPIAVRKIRSKCSWQRPISNDPVNRHFQYSGKPLLTVRHANPLPVVRSEAVQSAQEVQDVPSFKHDPRTIGYLHDYKHGATIPGESSLHEYKINYCNHYNA